MKKLFKAIAGFFCFIPCVNNYYRKWQLFGRVPFGLIMVNNIHRKIYRINSRVKFPIHFTSRVIGFDRMELSYDPTTIGSFVLSGGCYFQALNGIRIGKNFLFAPGVKLISSNHDISDKKQVEKAPPIVIGDNVWLGANVIILPGITIGNNVVIGAGSVVTKPIPDNVTVAGNPARILNTLNENGSE